MWPLLLRELRLEARRPFNRWLRIGAALIFFLILLGGLQRASGWSEVGRRVFPALHGLLLVLPWAVAPVLVAEVIARERRTGMLEQLQLTRVTWGAIVRSITLAVVMRTVTLMLAAFPMVGLAVLFGGVGPQELEFAALLQTYSMILALTVALIAGTLGRTWATAAAWAIGLGVLLGGGSAFELFRRFQASVVPALAPKLWPTPEAPRMWIEGAVKLVADQDLVWGPTLSVLPARLVEAWRYIGFGAIGIAFALYLFAGTVSAWILRHSLRASANKPASSHAEAGRFWLPGPVSPEVRRRWLRRNPMRWLTRYPAGVRWIRGLAACAVGVVEALVYLMRIPFSEWFAVQAFLLVIMGGALAMAAAESFRRERESGALELLLVTPLRPRDLAHGRIGGLWWIFGPAFLVWAASLWVAVPILRTGENQVALFIWGGALFVTVPAVGLEAAFQFRGYWRSAVATLALTLGLSGGLFWMGLADEAVFWITALNVLILGIIASLSLPGFEQRFTRRRNGEVPAHFQFRPEAEDSPYARLTGPRPRIPVSRFRQR